MTDKKLQKPYDFKETEDRIYKRWENSGLFSPDKCIKEDVTAKNAPVFSIVLPPPNVTGVLHMGHSIIVAIQDILTRYHRMRGDRTLWIPGVDHAAIATQSKVEGIIKKEEGKSRHDLGREELLKRIEEYAQKSHDNIVYQMRKLGASVDWKREAYTLDEKRSFAVRTAFKKMYDDRLIYRGYRVVNWDPKGQTTVSDDEVEHKEGKGVLYTFRYSKEFPIPIATTRPETKVGDTAVAVNPEDSRYKKFIGNVYDVDFVGIKLNIKIVADSVVDPNFGTGAVGVTPAHSMTDFEIGKRHDLPVVQVINEFGRMMIDDAELSNKKVADARSKIVERLKSSRLLTEEKEILQNIAFAYRTGGTIEPLPKMQWFVDVNKKFRLKHSFIKGINSGEEVSLKQIMRLSVSDGEIKIVPDYLSKTYFHWIDNLSDWCISRQIWFGHRIPVWYKKEKSINNLQNKNNDSIYVGVDAPKERGWEQDPDTLDTWFSSGLWSFTTLGWPKSDALGVSVFNDDGTINKESDLGIYHPTSVLETGYDILFFWVARMILMSGYIFGDVPFRVVYLHGLVRDKQGRKMSKSLGNIIDPLDMILKYGADAVRMSLIIGNTPGTDTNLSEDKIKGYKHFANKMWNATRYVLTATDKFNFQAQPPLSQIDMDYLTVLQKLTKEVTSDIEEYRFYLAGEKLYHYFWHTFADIVIEESKKRLVISGSDASSCKWTLHVILTTTITLLHPFMPFVTEEIWGIIYGEKSKGLIIQPWPKF